MIRLRPMKKEELRLLTGWFSDEAVFAMWSAGKFDYPLTEEQLISYYEKFEQDPCGWIFAALDENGRVTGHIMMREADYEKQSIHFGFIAMAPEARGKGLGREMVAQALKYAGEILGMKQATLGVFANNPGAKRCYESAGFRPVRAVEAAYEFYGAPWTVILMEAAL